MIALLVYTPALKERGGKKLRVKAAAWEGPSASFYAAGFWHFEAQQVSPCGGKNPWKEKVQALSDGGPATSWSDRQGGSS